MSAGTPARPSIIIFNLSDVVTRGIDDALLEELSSGTFGITFSPIKESVFCDPAALDVFNQAAKGLGASGDDYLKAVIDAGKWKISLGDLRKAVLERLHHEVPGMKELLQELKRKGFRLVLESNHIAEWVADIRRHHTFLDNVFEHQVFSFETGRLNKDAGAFEAMATSLGITPAECLYVGNSEKSGSAARVSGMRAIHFTAVAALRRELTAMEVFNT